MAFKYQCLRGVFWISNWERRKYEEVYENQRTLLCSICVPAIAWRDSGIPRKSNMTMWTHCTNQLSVTWLKPHTCNSCNFHTQRSKSNKKMDVIT
jgi:hypothetical protein